ncbi:MAG: carboxypeptidase regulatory-like domain-containing protein [Chloroflexi bacterium]|nr:carboxypeptidase regulatory-like domain-containing protein [Chloroflexota bacterium]
MKATRIGLAALLALLASGLTACDRISLPSPFEEKIRTPPLADAIILDPTVTYQTMVGWETNAGIGSVDFIVDFQKWSGAAVELAVNGLGINRVRLEIKSGAENPVDSFTPYMNGTLSRAAWKAGWYTPVNDDADPNTINLSGFQFSALDHSIDTVVLPMKQLVEANGETLYVNLNYVDFETTSGLHHQDPDEYAEFMLATFQHMQSKYGFVPDAIEIILEPDNSLWDGSKIGLSIVATANLLQANGFAPPDFVGPSTTSMAIAIDYFDDMIGVPGVSGLLTEISYHRYRGTSAANAQKLADRAAEHGLRTAMLEHIGADYHELHEDLTVGNISSWQQFTLAFPSSDNGAHYFIIGNPTGASPTVSYGDRTRYLRQYFKYIRAGAQRIEATRTDGFSPAAFVNADGGYVVVVKADRAGEFTLRGLPPGRYGISYTTESENNVELANVGINFQNEDIAVAIRGSGVITVYSK